MGLAGRAGSAERQFGPIHRRVGMANSVRGSNQITICAGGICRSCQDGWRDSDDDATSRRFWALASKLRELVWKHEFSCGGAFLRRSPRVHVRWRPVMRPARQGGKAIANVLPAPRRCALVISRYLVAAALPFAPVESPHRDGRKIDEEPGSNDFAARRRCGSSEAAASPELVRSCVDSP
jgi:hypothetical protein